MGENESKSSDVFGLKSKEIKGDGSIYFKLSIPENRTVPFSY